MKNIKINNPSKFLITILFIYLIIGIFKTEFIFQALQNTNQLIIRILPILSLVFIVIFIINKYLKTNQIKKHLGQNSNWKTWFYVGLAGILISWPPYVFFPMLKELKDKGMTNSLIAIFLYNRNVKIPFIPIMIFYFGLPFTIILSFYIIIFSFLNGLLINYLVKEN